MVFDNVLFDGGFVGEVVVINKRGYVRVRLIKEGDVEDILINIFFVWFYFGNVSIVGVFDRFDLVLEVFSYYIREEVVVMLLFGIVVFDVFLFFGVVVEIVFELVGFNGEVGYGDS